MSSFNPFAARRERKEEAMKERLAELQQKQQQQQGLMQTGELSASTAESMGTLSLPETSYESEDFDKYLPASARVDQAPPAWSGRASTAVAQYEPPSRAWQCFAKLQNGFMIGASLGGAVGFLYGSWAAVAYKHILYLPIAVLQSGGFFGLFLACGTVIRCEETGEVIALRDGRAEHAGARRRPLAVEAVGTWRRPAYLDSVAPLPSVPVRSAVISAVFAD